MTVNVTASSLQECEWAKFESVAAELAIMEVMARNITRGDFGLALALWGASGMSRGRRCVLRSA